LTAAFVVLHNRKINLRNFVLKTLGMAKVKKSKGYSLHIGLNAVNPTHYGGWSGPLNACEADANDMATLAKNMKSFTSIKKLLTKKATRKNTIRVLTDYAKLARKGDFIFLTYSGHGGQLPDKNNDENDSQDETWCLYDGELVDDELYGLFGKLKLGVRVFVLSDSCHSGSVTRELYYRPTRAEESVKKRFMPPDIALKTYRDNKEFYDKLLKKPADKEKIKANIPASILLISGCKDNQESSDGDFNGLFTAKLLLTWNEGKFSGGYKLFHKKILQLMPPDQSPNYYRVGKAFPAFEKQRPFTV
jgi:metacaspase-1